MIVYFTGTGNSRACARLLADRLEDDCTDAFPLIRENLSAELVSERPWVFVCPTYAWQLPRVFAQLIRRSDFSGSKDAYFVLTCGGEIGNAMANNQALCAEKGLRYRGTLPVVMPDNYIAMFNAPGEEEAKRILSAARPILEQGAAFIRKGLDFPMRKAGFLDKLKSGVVNDGFYRFHIKTGPFTVDDRCISCGKCERDCPLANIRLEEGRPVWGSRCTHCMSCICLCPTSAIEYGKASRGKPRYRCPGFEN